ncbi:DsbA family protein [Zhihengliuella halotolerans]|uniref:Thioredoxin-like protein n=1 Tax=Zhihengliuella halotolerans TaxID=370736 RepID=A0A4Q8AAQ8_9MICC|nr:thioredoxin domain-containing protein [Zhihengliuella halotolerans]RZU60579.1 thioredoxin-like protein [Zhihengliuella halotolerans]
MADSANRPTKAERTSAAREAARKLHEEQAAAAKRKSLFVKLGVIGAMVLVIALVVMIVVQQRSAAVPESGGIPNGGNEHGGIVLVADGEGGTTVDPELTGDRTIDVNDAGEQAPQGTEPAPRGLDESADPAQLVVYADVNCPHCSVFDGQYAEQIEQWVADGDVVLEQRNVAFLDRGSSTNYSSRGANALACVADAAPESYMDFSNALFAQQPEGELTNAEMADLAAENGAEGLEDCIDSMEYRPFAQFAHDAALADAVPGTPSVWLNGEVWDGQADPDFAVWAEEKIG